MQPVAAELAREVWGIVSQLDDLNRRYSALREMAGDLLDAWRSGDRGQIETAVTGLDVLLERNGTWQP